MCTPYETVGVERTEFGVVAAVALPAGKEPVPEEVLARLPAEERAIASGLRGFRGPEWVGGRLALRRAAKEALGIELGPVGIGPRKEPLLPPGIAGSVAHKRGMAVAVVARVEDGTLGIDLEDPGPERVGVERLVLGPNELSALPATDRWPAVLARFAVKEALYKALHPHVNRYVGFSEATVAMTGGEPSVTLRLLHGEGPFSVEARLGTLHDRLLALVRVRKG
jgi:4'-phosphopantetheinyl transferase EntD